MMWQIVVLDDKLRWMTRRYADSRVAIKQAEVYFQRHPEAKSVIVSREDGNEIVWSKER